jgi:NAD(P)-dependent dehydrogenase (short-subunit alcohol dehydrogenase family)
MTVLDGRAAIVTGASSGIGRAIALRFAQEGAVVALADIDERPKEGGETTLELIRDAGGDAFFQRTDVSEWTDIDGIVSKLVDRHGSLDIMVNNAATYVSKPLLETSEEEWARVIAVNLTGMFLGCKRAIQQMLTQEPRNEVRGRIVNITSQHGMISAPRDFAYGVSKAGGVYMTRQIAADYASDLIICNAVAPGKILTGKPGVAVDPEKLDYARRRTPLPRIGRPDDVANAALYLASDQATYMTGVNLMVDGGWMAA